MFYYSTGIFEEIFPDIADILTVTIGTLNVLMTILAVFLMDRAGRRGLLITYAGVPRASSHRGATSALRADRPAGTAG